MLEIRAINNIPVYIEKNSEIIFNESTDKFEKREKRKYFLEDGGYISEITSSIFSLRTHKDIKIRGITNGTQTNWKSGVFYQDKNATLLDPNGNMVCVRYDNHYQSYGKRDKDLIPFVIRLLNKKHKYPYCKGYCLYHPKLVGTTHQERLDKGLYKKYIKLNKK